MSRSEYDAHKHLARKKTYAEGVVDGRREARNQIQRKRDREAYNAVLMWIACVLSGFAAGVLTAIARGVA